MGVSLPCGERCRSEDRRSKGRAATRDEVGVRMLTFWSNVRNLGELCVQFASDSLGSRPPRASRFPDGHCCGFGRGFHDPVSAAR